MPENEFGERIHNFFGQEGLPQDQHQSQVVDGSWSSFSNGVVGNRRQIDPSLIANLKSYSTQQSVDHERGQSSHSHHGLNFPQQPMRSEYSRSILQENQQPANGYMHGNHILQASQTEANVLGVDVESSRDRLSARGFTPDIHKSPSRFEMGESPVNYDFFGGQQQLNTQLPGMLQPFPRQQMSFNDMQLLKQQVMVKQMQQHLHKQQLEARQRNSLNINAVNGSCTSDNQSHALIGGIGVQDASSNCWQPELMTGNTNWMHRGLPPAVQGSSSGLMITPEHGQANLLAQQFEPSLYEMPVGEANAPQNAFSSVQMNRLAAQHGSANKGSSLTNQRTSFLNQGDVQDSHMTPRSTYQENLLFPYTSVPGSNNRPNLESLQQDDSRERNTSGQEKFGQMEGSGLSEKSMQKSSTLDPTEEKILFGSDDNLWDAFGSSTDMSMTGNLMSNSSDLYDACPSLQSGSWSALMQSAVAETSSDGAVVHEWGIKQQSVLANNNTVLHATSHIGNRSQDLGVKASITVSERAYNDTTQTAVQHLQDRGNKASDHGLLDKSMAQRNKMAENIFHSSSFIDGHNNSCSVQKNEGIEDRLGIWKAASNPDIAALKEQRNPFTQNSQIQKANYGFASVGNSSSSYGDVQGNIQLHLDNNLVEKASPQLKSRNGIQILESYSSNNAGSNDMVNSRDLSMLPGGKETLSGHDGFRPSIPRKFQYHPMGNIDVSDEPCPEIFSHFRQSKSFGQPAMNSQIDRGYISQNDVNRKNEAFKGMGSENSPSTSASADRSVDGGNQVDSTSSRRELLHKVDRSQERSLETNASEEKTSSVYGGQLRHSPSQGFNLQLAPPSQPAATPDNEQISQNSLQPLISPHNVPEKGGLGQSRFAPWASNQSLPQQFTHKGPFPGILGESNMNSGFLYSRGYHHNQQMPVANYSVNSSFDLSTPLVKERGELNDFNQRGHSAQTPSLRNPTTQNKKGDSAEGLPMLSASQPLVASSSPQQGSSSGMMSDSRASISAPQHRFWNQQSKPQPDNLRPHPLASNNMESSFIRQEKTNHMSSQNVGDVSFSGRDMVNFHELQSKDMSTKQTSMSSHIVQSNLQFFDRSLPSNNLPKDSLRHNEQMAGSREGDAPKMTVKRVENSAIDPQKVAPKGEQESPSRFDGLNKDGLNHKELANHLPHFGQTVSQSFSNTNHPALARADHQQISPQMAPSWYSQFGTFKNGLVKPVNDTGRFTPLKIGEQSSNVGSSIDGTHSVQSLELFNMQQMSGSKPRVETPSSESLPHGATDKLLKDDKPKKRKTVTSELLPWNKEVMQVPQGLKTLSEVEIDWARATNRFAEKVEFETLFENGLPIRSKRRLIYATQLMQQLFDPPPGGMISLVASSNYEFVAYTAARAALGDACSSSCRDKSERFSSPNDSYLLSARTKTEKISDQYISKAAEDFISRTQKLETDFAGLENGTTITDLRVEVQDLERFAVINRFARFHPPSSAMDWTGSSLRLNPQRYVTIAPMPQNIPDRVQCLQL